MKFCTAFLISVILSTLLSSVVFADEWQKEPRGNTNRAMLVSYSLYVPEGTCRINIMIDGTVTGYAIDHNWSGGVVIDTIVLKTKNGEKALERDINYYAPGDRFLSEGGYPAFEEKCFPQIKFLPPEVQERLKGWFEIE